MSTKSDYVTVTVTNTLGEERTLRLAQGQVQPDGRTRGEELVDYLKSLARREELHSVTVEGEGEKPKRTTSKPADED